MIGNKIADKITSLAKPKEKTKKAEEIYIPPEKDNKLLMTLNCSECIRMEFQKNCKFVWHDFWW